MNKTVRRKLFEKEDIQLVDQRPNNDDADDNDCVFFQFHRAKLFLNALVMIGALTFQDYQNRKWSIQ